MKKSGAGNILTDFDYKSYCRTLTPLPGVYKMLDAKDKVIYVGKAANLKKRIRSYFGRKHESAKTWSMVRHVKRIEVAVTNNEIDALLLENNLIKELRPRYNIVFRDDKSFPYIHLSSNHEFPRFSFYRGAKKTEGRYFGPFPNAGAARQTLNLTQKIFQVRQCDDTFFRNRSRPCLQYQIKRCSAPCVAMIDSAEYGEAVRNTILFLEGKNEEVIDLLTVPMQKASDSLDYERAAHYRDQISAVRKIQGQRIIDMKAGEMDIIGCSISAEMACMQVFMIRNGRNLGNAVIFTDHTKGADYPDITSAFISQYYLGTERQIPSELLLSRQPADVRLIEQVLTQQAGKTIRIRSSLRGIRSKWLGMAVQNADIALNQRMAGRQGVEKKLAALRHALKLEDIPARIECFDISHTGGEATVASCVVYGTEGAVKSAYRRFNIKAITAGDDYAAMRQVIERRYTRIKEEEGTLPDLILIDGGKGQVSATREVLGELQLGEIPILGIAKGPLRKSGIETCLLSSSNRTFKLPRGSPELHLLLEIRDEAHRFAIGGHRRRRSHARNQSYLEQITGIGAKRRQQLIRHFGGIQGVVRAGIEDLVKVPGINKNLAARIYHKLHHGP